MPNVPTVACYWWMHFLLNFSHFLSGKHVFPPDVCFTSRLQRFKELSRRTNLDAYIQNATAFVIDSVFFESAQSCGNKLFDATFSLLRVSNTSNTLHLCMNYRYGFDLALSCLALFMKHCPNVGRRDKSVRVKVYCFSKHYHVLRLLCRVLCSRARVDLIL